jgi:hypothetical protein
MDLYEEFAPKEGEAVTDKEPKADQQQQQPKTDQQKQKPKTAEIPDDHIQRMFKVGDIDDFIGEYGIDALPKSGAPIRPRVNDFEMRAWDNLWGRYYNADGTLK